MRPRAYDFPGSGLTIPQPHNTIEVAKVAEQWNDRGSMQSSVAQRCLSSCSASSTSRVRTQRSHQPRVPKSRPSPNGHVPRAAVGSRDRAIPMNLAPASARTGRASGAVPPRVRVACAAAKVRAQAPPPSVAVRACSSICPGRQRRKRRQRWDELPSADIRRLGWRRHSCRVCDPGRGRPVRRCPSDYRPAGEAEWRKARLTKPFNKPPLTSLSTTASRLPMTADRCCHCHSTRRRSLSVVKRRSSSRG